MKKLQDVINLDEAIKKAEEEYKFQPGLTDKLDKHQGDFTEMTLLEIMLWKINRYPTTNSEILNQINELRRNPTQEIAKSLLHLLLDNEIKGFDLPTASAVLRFAAPYKFQIIDQRVYRFITPDATYLKIPYSIENKIELYFDYLERLKNVCKERHIPFEKSDRILYHMDKYLNKDIKLTNYGSNKTLP